MVRRTTADTTTATVARRGRGGSGRDEPSPRVIVIRAMVTTTASLTCQRRSNAAFA